MQSRSDRKFGTAKGRHVWKSSTKNIIEGDRVCIHILYTRYFLRTYLDYFFFAQFALFFLFMGFIFFNGLGTSANLPFLFSTNFAFLEKEILFGIWPRPRKERHASVSLSNCFACSRSITLKMLLLFGSVFMFVCVCVCVCVYVCYWCVLNNKNNLINSEFLS